MNKVEIRIAEAPVSIQQARIYTGPIDASFEYDCNVGQDILSQFGENVIDFHSMSIQLREKPDTDL